MRKVEIGNICFNIPFLEEKVKHTDPTFVEVKSEGIYTVRKVYKNDNTYTIDPRNYRRTTEEQRLRLRESGRVVSGPKKTEDTWEFYEWKHYVGPELEF